MSCPIQRDPAFQGGDEKTSTRTRSAFEVAAYDQGAHVTYLDPGGSQLSHRKSIADTARVLGRMSDANEFRGAAQRDVETLAADAGAPVYNGLTDVWHPTPMLAAFLIIHESCHVPTRPSPTPTWETRSNVGRSLQVMGAIMGSDVRIARRGSSGRRRTCRTSPPSGDCGRGRS